MKEYEKHYQAIDKLPDQVLLQLATSNYYQYQPDLRAYVNREVINRRLSVVQLDSVALVADGSENRARTRQPHLTAEDISDFIIRVFFILLIIFCGGVTTFAIRKAGYWLAISELNILIFLMVRCIKEPIKLVVHYIFIKGIIGWRQRRAINALESISERPLERPVVYLRSFIDDPKGAKVIGLSTEEEQIAITFHQIGPFVALGRPGETLPQIGAARVYIKNERWQEVVEEFMVKAQMTIMRIGRTDGFWWEFRRAIHNVPPERLLLLVPCDKELYRDFRMKAEALMSHRLPEYKGGVRDMAPICHWVHWIFFKSFPYIGRIGSLRGILFFEPDWTPHFVKFQITLRGTLKAPGAAALIIALQPVLNRLGLNIPVPGFRWMRMLSLTLLIISLYLFFLLVMLDLSRIAERFIFFLESL